MSGAGAAKHVLSRRGMTCYPELVETNYGAAFQHVGLRVRKRSLIVLFTQVVDDVAASELLRLMRGVMPRHLPLMVLLRDVDDRRAGRGRRRRPLHAGAAAELSSFRDRLVRDLKNHGALVLDVAPGQLTGSSSTGISRSRRAICSDCAPARAPTLHGATWSCSGRARGRAAPMPPGSAGRDPLRALAAGALGARAAGSG